MLDKMQKDQVLENLNSCLNDNFWIAYDALEPKKAETILVKGIEVAKELQQAIIRQGTSIIERKEVKVADYFRYVMLENDYLADIKLFQYPLALQKLGQFIMEDYKEHKPSAKEKPLVISVKNSKKGTTLVLAVMGPQLSDKRK
jgi:cell division control protein 45